jgi:hypothetical protein
MNFSVSGLSDSSIDVDYPVVVTIDVPDRALAGTYHVEVIEVADMRNDLFPDATGYELMLR